MGKHGEKGGKQQQAPLSGAEIAALNRAFYGTDPADHFSRHLHQLLEQAGSSEVELRAETREYKFGKLSMTIPSVDEGEVDEDAHKRYILVEAELFVHHVAETLMRLFFAHSSNPPAPWVEMTKLRGPGEFKRRLQRFRKGQRKDTVVEEIRFVFFGYRQFPAEWSQEKLAQNQKGLQQVSEFLDYFAELLLERGQTYNAVKHGLAAQAGEAAIEVGRIEELSAGGPSIAYLDRGRDDENKSTWVVKTRWIPLEFDISLAYVGTQLLSALWTVARIRYVKWPIPKDGQRLSIPAISLAEIRDAAEMPAIQIQEIAFPADMHCPPGAGADALIAHQEESEDHTEA